MFELGHCSIHMYNIFFGISLISKSIFEEDWYMTAIKRGYKYHDPTSIKGTTLNRRKRPRKIYFHCAVDWLKLCSTYIFYTDSNIRFEINKYDKYEKLLTHPAPDDACCSSMRRSDPEERRVNEQVLTNTLTGGAKYTGVGGIEEDVLTHSVPAMWC